MSIQDLNELYKVYKIRTGRSGKLRQIEEPTHHVKQNQKSILEMLEQENLAFHSGCMAVSGKSIADNAAVHEGCKYILRIDLKSCYQTIKSHHVERGIRFLRSKTHALIDDIIQMCMFRDQKGEFILPTGAPTSPFLCNVALTPLDFKIDKIAKVMGYKYTRYIDDMHLSTTNEKRDWVLLDLISKEIKDYGLKVNKKKSKWFTNNGTDNIIVTGVRLGQKYKVPRELRRRVRAILHHHASNQLPLSKKAKGYLAHIKSIDPDLHNVMVEKYEESNESFKRKCASPEFVLPSNQGM